MSMNFLPPTEMKRTQLLHELFIDAILGTGNQYLCSTLSSWFNIQYFSKSKKKMTNLVKEKEHERKKKLGERGLQTCFYSNKIWTMRKD